VTSILDTMVDKSFYETSFRLRTLLLYAVLILTITLPLSHSDNQMIGDSQYIRSDTTTTKKGDNDNRFEPHSDAKPLKIAYCITGQLARLELFSKMKNIFIANADKGHYPHIFIFLDNEVELVKQTYWTYDYSNALYGSYTEEDLQSLLEAAADVTGHKERFVHNIEMMHVTFQILFI
jgi:hypothetical protein